jgi:HD superfamily phosphodiesterase
MFTVVMPREEVDVLSAAAYVHDIGYAPELALTGFHPLDGARFARAAGHERLARLIAHHSASTAEAEERHLAAELAEFPEEDSLVARALVYCDLTTGPGGEQLDVSARLADVAERLGEDDPAVRAVRRDAARLTAIVSEMESLLAVGT